MLDLKRRNYKYLLSLPDTLLYLLMSTYLITDSLYFSTMRFTVMKLRVLTFTIITVTSYYIISTNVEVVSQSCWPLQVHVKVFKFLKDNKFFWLVWLLVDWLSIRVLVESECNCSKTVVVYKVFQNIIFVYFLF